MRRTRSDRGRRARAAGALCRWMTVVVPVVAWTQAAAVAADQFVDRASELGLVFHHFNGMSGELYFSEMMGSGAALLDYDGDGDLDAYLVQGHMLGDKDVGRATCALRHPLPLVDRLFRNDLRGAADDSATPAFVDVTDSSAIRSAGYGMGVAVGDVDNDGDPDLYVTNAGPNELWRNNGDGTFSDATAASGTGDRGWGVSAAFVDIDRDGWLDLYVGNYVEYRLANDKECISQTGAADYCGPLAYRSQADRLYRNRGDGTFEDFTAAAGIAAERPGSALGVVAGDFNGDDWPDIYVANDQMPNFLWMNQGGGRFVNEALFSGSAVNEDGQPQASMGLVVGDLNGDGVEDLFMSHLTRETNTLYLNDGTGLFTDSSRDSGLAMPSWQSTGFGVALFDYDLDGWLDLLVVNGAVKILEELARAGDPYPLHQPDQLFRNLGGARFEEVTAQAGEVFRLSEVGRGVATGDVENDGDPDVLVSNSAGPARLLINRGGEGRAWLGVRLVAAAAEGTVLGARVAIEKADGTTLWRRFASDGSYASANDPRVLAGLGEATAADSVTVRVRWPGGGVQEWRGVPAGVFVTLRPSSRRSST